MPQTRDHITRSSAKVTLPSARRDAFTRFAFTTKEASVKSKRRESRVASSTKPTSLRDSSTEMIRPCQLSGTPSFVQTVRFRTVLEFFHISNFSKATLEEAIFLHVLYSQVATQAEMLRAVLPWSVQRPLQALLAAMNEPGKNYSERSAKRKGRSLQNENYRAKHITSRRAVQGSARVSWLSVKWRTGVLR